MPRPGIIGTLLLAISSVAPSQQDGVAVRPTAWQAVGPRTVDLKLAGPAGGAVIDVFFSADGGRLFAVTSRGALWMTSDLGETWNRTVLNPTTVGPLARRNETAVGESSPGEPPLAGIHRHPYDPRYLFALGDHVYRSSDQGRTWVNLTGDGVGSVIGSGQKAIAFSPLDPGLIVVANSRGLWRSTDAGLSWSDLNRNLPNLPEARLNRFSDGVEPRVFLQGVGPTAWSGSADWYPAREERFESWLRAMAALPEGDQRRSPAWPVEAPSGWTVSYRVWRQGAAISPDLTLCGETGPLCANPEQRYISAFAGAMGPQPVFYAGTSDGRLWVSTDGGSNWQRSMQGFPADAGPVTGIVASAQDPRVAVVVLGGQGTAQVLRTTNAGLFWDDLSTNLPDAPVRAVAANAETGSMYVASEAGVFYTRGDLRNPAPGTPWVRLGGNLPQAPIEDVRLDAVTGTLYVAVAAYGVFRTAVPDIADALRVLNAADLSARAAAPGGLLTVIGAPVRSARAGAQTAPVLATNQNESQIQVPFEASGGTLQLALETPRGSATVGLPLETVSPAIFVDSDGSPLVLEAAGGLLIEGSRPARAGGQILVLATGLGRVRPDWPTGLAAPLDDPPATIAPVTAFLDGSPVRVVSSTLAGGYIGVYLVRVELPTVLNAGTAELFIVAGDKTSNRVRIFVDPVP